MRHTALRLLEVIGLRRSYIASRSILKEKR
jgi:hypothetical protein